MKRLTPGRKQGRSPRPWRSKPTTCYVCHVIMRNSYMFWGNSSLNTRHHNMPSDEHLRHLCEKYKHMPNDDDACISTCAKVCVYFYSKRHGRRDMIEVKSVETENAHWDMHYDVSKKAWVKGRLQND